MTAIFRQHINKSGLIYRCRGLERSHIQARSQTWAWMKVWTQIRGSFPVCQERLPARTDTQRLQTLICIFCPNVSTCLDPSCTPVCVSSKADQSEVLQTLFLFLCQARRSSKIALPASSLSENQTWGLVVALSFNSASPGECNLSYGRVNNNQHNDDQLSLSSSSIIEASRGDQACIGFPDNRRNFQFFVSNIMHLFFKLCAFIF